jgi:transposase-like protein
VDGIRVAEHCCVVALGITIDGTKVPLGLAVRGQVLMSFRVRAHV